MNLMLFLTGFLIGTPIGYVVGQIFWDFFFEDNWSNEFELEEDW